MILVSENSTADDGAYVQSTVTLFIERIGVELPFRVNTYVNREAMSTLRQSHHATEAEARGARAGLHAAYLAVHSTKHGG